MKDAPAGDRYIRTRGGISEPDRRQPRLLNLVIADRIIPLLTPALFLEYEEVLKRANQLTVSLLTPADIDRFLTGFAVASEEVVIHYTWRRSLPIPTTRWC